MRTEWRAFSYALSLYAEEQKRFLDHFADAPGRDDDHGHKAKLILRFPVKPANPYIKHSFC